MSAPKHSRLSPSKAYQWTTCTASIGYAEANRDRIPPDRAGPAAIEGSKAHNVAEAILTGTPIPDYATPEMIRFGHAYAAVCREKMGPKQHCFDWGVEARVPLSYLPEEAGTCDFYCATRTGVHIVDYKYGYNKVQSENNKQMAIYAGSLILHEKDSLFWPHITDATPVTMTIFQPRLDDDVVTWSTTWGELRKFLEEQVHCHAGTILATPAGEMRKLPGGGEHYVHDPRVKFAPGDKTCTYCPCYAFCEARLAGMLEEFQEAITLDSDEGVQVKPVAALTDAQLMHIYQNSNQITDWLGEIRKYLEAKTFSKDGLPGMKIVLSNGGHRYWSDEDRAAALLKDLGIKETDIFKRDIVSPAQAEKLTKDIKSRHMQELFKLMTKPPGKPMMAPENDPRPAWRESVLDDFKDLLETDD
jgi:hypothetical protein